MKRQSIPLICLALIALASSGCNPRIRVRKSPSPHDSGIRYYRPKPYLLITPASSTIRVTESKKETSIPSVSDEYVNIELQYLPDFSEEYALDVRPGLGTADVSFTLQDGWMLTEVNQKLDSQFDENLEATAELLKAGASIVPTGGVLNAAGGDPAEVTRKWVVAATNIPLGYYESVVSQGACGKALAGWRYVGFAPFNSCSTVFCGSDAASCSDPQSGPVYGLAFVEGVMTFRRLDDLQRPATLEKHEVPFGQTTGSRVTQVVLNADQLGKLESQIATEIETSGTGVDIAVSIRKNRESQIDFDYITTVEFQTLLDPDSLAVRLPEMEQEIKSLFPAGTKVRVDLSPTTIRSTGKAKEHFTVDPASSFPLP